MTAFLVAVICAHPIATSWFGMLAFGCVVGIWMASQDDADLAHDVDVALRRSGWPQEASAVQVGLSRQRFSSQMNCHEPITFLARALTRMQGFEREFLTLRARRAQLLVVERGELADAVTAVRALAMVKADLKAGA